jgi:hypothetical protein
MPWSPLRLIGIKDTTVRSALERIDSFLAMQQPAASVSGAWPIGSIFISAVATDPATLLGFGTWSAHGAGRVLVGIDPGDPDFGVLGATTGAKTVAAAGTLSAPTFTGAALGTHSHGAGTLAPSAHSGAAVGSHASHTHAYSEVLNHTHAVNVTDAGHNHDQDEHQHVQYGYGVAKIAGTYQAGSDGDVGDMVAPDVYTAGTTATNQAATTGITATTSAPAGGVASGTTAGPGAPLTHSVTQPSDHTMAGASDAVSAGTPAGSVSAPAFTGSASSVVQPSIVVHIWTRIA